MTLKRQTLHVHVQNRTYMLKCGTATNAVVRGRILRFKFLALVALLHTTPPQVSSSVHDANCPSVQRPSAKYITTTFAHRFGRNVNIYKGETFLAGVAIIPSFFGS